LESSFLLNDIGENILVLALSEHFQRLKISSNKRVNFQKGK